MPRARRSQENRNDGVTVYTVRRLQENRNGGVTMPRARMLQRDQKRMRYNTQSAYVTKTKALQRTERVRYKETETKARHYQLELDSARTRAAYERCELPGVTRFAW